MLDSRPVAIGLALAIAVGAAVLLNRLDPDLRPERAAFDRLQQPQPDLERAAVLYADALRNDPANPYRWADLGETLHRAGRSGPARACFRRALLLSRDVPQIWLRDVNFHIELGETGPALDSAGRVLRTVPDYDGVLFSSFDRFAPDPDQVLAAIGGWRRPAQAYVRHLVTTGDMTRARSAWQRLGAAGFQDAQLAGVYLDGLLRARLYDEAQRDWAAFTSAWRGDYPEANLVYNGSFEQAASGAPLDWTIDRSDEFETIVDGSVARTGRSSTRVRFRGTGNVAYAHLSQRVCIRPGSYVLEAWVRTQEITTAEGPRLHLFDPEHPARIEVRTEPFVGTRDWSPVTCRLNVPSGTRILVLRLLRTPSTKFDNKISGTIWLDSVRLSPQ